MRRSSYLPHGYGGARRDPDQVKRDGWKDQGLLAVNLEDPRLSWPEREFVMQLGHKLYGQRPQQKDTGND